MRLERNCGRRLDLRQPRTYNEKIYWLMLHYRPPILTRLADKYKARSYVAGRIGEKYLNEPRRQLATWLRRPHMSAGS